MDHYKEILQTTHAQPRRLPNHSRSLASLHIDLDAIRWRSPRIVCIIVPPSSSKFQPHLYLDLTDCSLLCIVTIPSDIIGLNLLVAHDLVLEAFDLIFQFINGTLCCTHVSSITLAAMSVVRSHGTIFMESTTRNHEMGTCLVREPSPKSLVKLVRLLTWNSSLTAA